MLKKNQNQNKRTLISWHVINSDGSIDNIEQIINSDGSIAKNSKKS